MDEQTADSPETEKNETDVDASEPTRPCALITGASSGIGVELAHVFAANGYDLVLTARREEQLLSVANDCAEKHGVQADVLPADLSLPDAPQLISRALVERGIAIESLVNNAGFGLHGKFAETDLQANLDMIQVNCSALVALTGLLMPPMLERRKGYIMNVASVAAYFPGPLMSVYYASKAFVLSYSEALAHEVKEYNVKVSALCPGPTESEFETVAGVSGSRLFRKKKMSARHVAEVGYRGLMKGKQAVIPGSKQYFVTTISKIFPRKWLGGAAHSLNVIRKPKDPDSTKS